jgi:hypothetical protein
MEKRREEMSPIDLVLRIEADLEALVNNAALFGRAGELDILEAAKRISFVSGVLEQELHLANENKS